MQKTKDKQNQWLADYEIIEKAIEFIQANTHQQPSLDQIASTVNLSQFHFQKLFSRWVGISPKRFLQFLTKEYAKQLLNDSENILDVAYDSGLSSPGRLHDLFIHCEAMTPGEYKKKGEGLAITYGFIASPFGRCLIASTQRGLCSLKFVRDQTEKQLIAWLTDQWPKAQLFQDNHAMEKFSCAIFPDNHLPAPPLHLHVKGTNFQIKVWEALIRIPSGHAVSYGQLARHIHRPGADRAVGTAVGKNPIPFLIPCHRVIRKTGVLGQYGEGRARKKALIAWEAAKKNP